MRGQASNGLATCPPSPGPSTFRPRISLRSDSPRVAGRHSTGCEKPPLAGHALERMRPAIFERNPRPEGKVPDRARDEYLPGPRQTHDPGSDMRREPSHAVSHHLDLTCVYAGADLESKVTYLCTNRLRTPHCSAGPVEYGEESVTGRLDLAPSESAQVPSNQIVVSFEESPPHLITNLGSALG